MYQLYELNVVADMLLWPFPWSTDGILFIQAGPGHKRAPSDASLASSDDDKVPPTPSTLESVTEKTEAEPVEDQTSDKFSDEGLGTSDVDKTEEEKINEVSDVSNEDLTSGIREPTTDFVSQAPAEPKSEDTQAEDIPAAPVVSQPEEPVDATEAQELVTDGRETEEELKETQEEKTENETTQVIEDEREAQEEKGDEQKEADVDESKGSQLEDKPEKTESVSGEVAQEEEEEPDEETPQHKVTADRIEDAANGTDVNIDTNNLKSVVIDTNRNSDANNKSIPEENVEIKPHDKHEAESPEEAEPPEQGGETREDQEQQEPTESTNGVSDETKEFSDDSEQVVASEDVTAKEVEEKAPHADESVSEEAVSVPDSEVDSETKTEQGSPVMKPDVESDSGSSSAADSSSVDLNLSISSFLSKSKEGGSLSMQVIYLLPHLPPQL